MGLGLGIAKLFVVSSFREELAAGAVERRRRGHRRDPGRTVLFTAVAVAASLSALCVPIVSFAR